MQYSIEVGGRIDCRAVAGKTGFENWRKWICKQAGEQRKKRKVSIAIAGEAEWLPPTESRGTGR